LSAAANGPPTTGQLPVVFWCAATQWTGGILARPSLKIGIGAVVYLEMVVAIVRVGCLLADMLTGSA
jgi:hypothetical protein